MEPDQPGPVVAPPAAAAGDQQPEAAAVEPAPAPMPANEPLAEGSDHDSSGMSGGSLSEGGSGEESYGREEEEACSLLVLAQRRVLANIEEACRDVGAAFSVGGSLGKLSVSLAVAPPPASGGSTENVQGHAQAGSSAGQAPKSTSFLRKIQSCIGDASHTAASASGSGTAQPGTAAQPIQAGQEEQAVVVRFPEGGEGDLAALLTACEPATFGRGTEAVLDDSYRRALAMPQSRIFPQFELAAHGGLLESVRRMLLPDSALLTAHLHTLNVYTAGGFFKPHRDTLRGSPHFVGSLVLCLPVAHTGGALRVEHGGHSVSYEWGAGASAGEVQWAAFFSDCLHEVLPVTSGARVTLAWELFAYPAEEADRLPAQVSSLPGNTSRMLGMLRAALDNNSFMVNGGQLGFPCKHAYPSSLVKGIKSKDVPALLKGEDAALMRVLQALGLSTRLLRVWKDEEEADVYVFCEEWPPRCEDDPSVQALMVSAVRPGCLTPPLGEYDVVDDVPSNWLQYVMGTHYDTSILWLGGVEAFPEWTLGVIQRFLGGNFPATVEEFYCSLGIVAKVPPYADRTQTSRLAWAGEAGPGPSPAPGAGGAVGEGHAGLSAAISSPVHKQQKTS